MYPGRSDSERRNSRPAKHKILNVSGKADHSARHTREELNVNRSRSQGQGQTCRFQQSRKWITTLTKNFIKTL